MKFKKHYLKQLLIAGVSSTLVACAAAPDGDEPRSRVRGDCIHEPSIRGYTVLDESNLVIEASGRRSYLVTLQRRAHGLRSTWQIGLRDRTSRVCAGFSEIVIDDGMVTDSIRIADIRELTPEDLEDLLIRYGRKEPEFERTPEPQEVRGADVEELDPDDSE